ncbi:MAG: fibronectin type III domain-containing protein [Candidatus Dormibacteraeota bacterium]|nr:fibronectin type III domain-containing protein [Candidatus Dormibacteraeota bacterium]
MLWPVQRAGFVSRNLGKVGLGIAAAVLLTSRAATEAPHLPHLNGRVAAAQSVPCGALAQGIVTWSSPSYILPSNDPNGAAPCTAGVIVGPGTTLVIDAGAGTVHIASSGAGLNIAGGTLKTVNADETLNPDGTRAHGIIFEAATDVASWDGINITASSASKGSASFSYVSIQGALRSIQISSGATSSPDDPHYGLTVRNSSIGFSYFDGIDAIDTPISITGLNDGKTGTINNIGSIAINATYDASAQAPPADALHIDGMTFGSSAPFGVSACPANQPCYIGNQAVFGKFVPHTSQPVWINNSKFYRAGTYGVQLESANQPTLTNNLFACNGLGAPTTGPNCSGSGPAYSAVLLNDATADLAQAPGSTGQITGNHGYGNGLDAIAFNGAVTSHAMTWQSATNVVSDTPNTHWLGYLLTGDLNMANASLRIPDDSVVKTLGGTINLTNSTLDAGGDGLKTFTSLRDPLAIPSCPSVFAPSCGPAVLPGGEWGGINLSGGSKATINKANIFYAATGIRIAGGATSTGSGSNYGLVVSNSTIGPTFSDGIAATGTPISVTNTNFQCVATGCLGPAAGDHGISADFTGSTALGGGLSLTGNTFHGSVNEAIKGIGLANQVVDIENNTVDHAGTAGIQLLGADRPTLKQNTITSSGTGTPTYPAIYLSGVTRADFNKAIIGNVGSRNGLDAIAFHGGTTALTWRTVANSTLTGPLGYLLDGPLLVNGALTLQQNDYVPSLGSITVTGGALTATGAVVTSLKDSTLNIPTCGSVFDQKVSGACPAATPGDWGGLSLDSSFASKLSGGSEIRYAATGIAMGKPGIAAPLTLNGTNFRNMSGDGIATQSSLAVSGGAFSNLGGRAIVVDLTGVAAGASVSISGASITGTGSEGILARGLAGQVVRIDTTSVDHPRAAGISLATADHLTLTNNTVTNAPAGYPAVYLNGFMGPFGAISGNRGAGNGLDALAFHGTVTDDLTWVTARKNGALRPLGYLLDGDLSLAGTLQVGAGDVVKSSGTLNLGHLRADDTSNAGQKVFTSLSDDMAGVAVCHPASVLLPGCTGAAPGDWGGINLTSDGALVNGAVRYAATGINVSSGASKTFGSSSYGLLVSRSRIDATKFDAIDSLGTPASLTNSSINGAIHGVEVDFTGGPSTAALRVSGNRFTNTAAEAVVGQALGGHPLWITDNQVQNATTFGVRLVGADQLVLRNNNISASGGGPAAGTARYPAIYLRQVTADFVRNVRGNVGSGNGLDAVMMDGTSSGDLNWITPSAAPPTHPLGYLLDGSLTVQGTLTARAGDEIKARGGPIMIKGGSLQATNATFTSLTDGTGPAVSCPSAFVIACGAAAGDWGGLVITQGSTGTQATASITSGFIKFAETAVATDNGPIAGIEPTIKLDGVEISHASKDGVNSLDTPIRIINHTKITTVGAHGIFASFFSPANCPAGTCHRLTVTDSEISGSAKDGIIANGLSGQPVMITETTVTNAGTYGIRLVGADVLTVTDNIINTSGNGSGTSAPKYPAMYLSGIKADFELAGTLGIAGNHGSANGLDAIVFHGEATQPLTWLTTGVAAAPAPPDHLGYMLDGDLVVDGSLRTQKLDVVKTLSGTITVKGALQSTGSLFTSMKDDLAGTPACGSILVVDRCATPAAAGDWGGLRVSGGPSLVGTSVVVRDAITGVTAGPGVAISCSSIQGNAVGVALAAGSSITQSDVFGNSAQDLAGTAGATADANWWGKDGGNFGGTPAGVATNPLKSQQPSLDSALGGSIALVDGNTNSLPPHKFGTGDLTITLNYSRQMDKGIQPTVRFAPDLNSVTGGWTVDPVTKQWTGTFALSHLGLPPTTDGVKTLQVGTARSCVPEVPGGSNSNLMAQPASPATFTTDLTQVAVPVNLPASLQGSSSGTLNGTVDPLGWPTTAHFEWTGLDSTVHQLPLTNPAISLAGGPQTIQARITSGLAPSRAYPFRVVATSGNGTITATPDLTLNTTGVATSFTITDPPASNVAGSGITETVAATDGTNVVADYMGNVTVSSTDSLATFKLAPGDTPTPLPTTLPFNASNFGSRVMTVIFKTSGPQSLTALDTHGLTGTGGGVTVVAASLDHLALSPNLSTVASNTGQAYTVDGRDAYENSLGDKTSLTTFTIAPDGTCVTATCSATTADVGASHHTVTGTFDGKTGTASLVVTARVPGAPTAVSATPGDRSAVVNWTVPADNGGSPITGYAVTSSPTGGTPVISGTTATVFGLTNGTTYSFTVVATNLAGNSVPSVPSSAVTPRTVPGAPTAVSATPGNGSAVVTWTAPADNGGSPITGYSVTSSPTGGTPVISGTTATVPALTNGTPYTFTVVATNLAGNSVPSVASSAVTPRTVPGSPTAVAATAGNGSAVVSWTSPADNGGSPITGYTVTSSPDNKTAASSGMSATVSGLTNGTAYTFTVVATNVAGNSPPSAPSAAVTPQTPPGVPSKLVFTTQPSGSSGGIAFGTQPVVVVEDSFGTVVTADNSSTVTLGITAGTGNSGGALTCTATVPTVNAGQATFAGCAINKISPPLNPYTLHATSSLAGVAAADSGPVPITQGPAARLRVTTQPSGSTGGIAFGTQPVVAVEDAGGNLETGDSSSTVALSINASTGDPAGVLTCTANPVTVSGGSATFAGCAIDKVSPGANPYTLHAVSSLTGVTAANTASLAITLGPAARVAFTTQPAGALAGIAFSTQPVVSIQDAGGNIVNTDTTSVVTLSITPLTGSPGAMLTCNPPSNSQTAVNGATTFTGCAINLSGTAYQVRASGAGFQVDSQPFTVS